LGENEDLPDVKASWLKAHGTFIGVWYSASLLMKQSRESAYDYLMTHEESPSA
jgi:hypothetical protein